MPYIDLAGLSRYASRQKDRLERDYALLRDMQWTRSEKAGAVSLWPVGGTPLKPVVDFLFTETPPAEGDKGPSNPSTITGVSEVNLWLAGKNINRTMPYYGFTDGVKVVNGVTFTANADGSVTANGLADGNANCSLHNSNSTSAYGEPIGVGVWIVSGCPSGSGYTYSLQTMISTGYGSSNGYEFGSGSTATITKPGAKIGLAIRIPSGYNAQNLVFKPQIELGNEKTSYEQSVEKQKYTISLGSTYYGGTLDVATGVMTVTWEGVVLTGEESVTRFVLAVDGFNRYRVGISYKPTAWLSCVCSHYTTYHNGGPGDNVCYMALSYPYAFNFIHNSINTADGFKSFLAAQYANGTPVTFVYNLDTPYTVQLTPTQILSLAQADKYTPRLNTVYSDQQAVQVGYVKSPIREEYELQQAVIAQGGNV